MKSFSLIISCGGTGGHFYPGLSIARECQKQEIPVRLYVAGKHSESQQKCADNYHIPADIGKAIRLPRKKWVFPFFLLVFGWTTLTSFFYLLKHRPKAILVMGSFASVPLGLAAVLTRTPLFLHEGNTVVGRANRFLSRWAKCLYLSFPIINGQAIKCPTKETGMPIRPELEEFPPSSESDKQKIGMDEELPLLMVFGGSQGALKINDSLYESLSDLCQKVQLIHLTGQPDNSQYISLAKQAGVPAKIETSTDKMADYYQAADIIICRAGASSLAEIALFAKPTIFIPLKIAAENHQFHNARLAEEAQGAAIICEDDLSKEALVSALNELLENEENRKTMAANMKGLSRREVAQTLVKTIVSSC